MRTNALRGTGPCSVGPGAVSSAAGRGVGQLWALTVTVNAWMEGNTATARWGAGFLILSFLVVIGPGLLDPKDR
ncbi:hypothetical protein [Streptomyces virginiae]|uniref:hypothetical protein n=1 Tax=Streptomyces virginiae TaxID=1961 RepID=UPI0034544B82